MLIYYSFNLLDIAIKHCIGKAAVGHALLTVSWFAITAKCVGTVSFTLGKIIFHVNMFYKSTSCLNLLVLCHWVKVNI